MTERKVICSPWLGEIKWNSGCELLFPCGLPGFEAERRIIPVEIPAQRPLVYLQSLEQDNICFLALPVLVIDPGFQLCLQEEERAVIMLPDDCQPVIGSDVLCLGLLVPADRTVTVNLSAPIVINLRNSMGVQCVSGAADRCCLRLGENGHWEMEC